MRTADLFEETYSALFANKIRTALTMLGIIIGISSVIAMVAIGQGAQVTIQNNIQSIGSNLLLVSPGVQRTAGSTVSAGRGSAKTLTIEDADAIENSLDGIKAVAPEVTGRYQITNKGTNTNTQVIGTTSGYAIARNIQVDSGVFLSDQQKSSGSKVAVIGPTTRDDLFGEGVDPVGQSIKINKIEFKIIGVTVAKGGSGFSNADDVVYIPITTAQRYLSGDSYVSTINIAAESSDTISQVETGVTNLLLTRHKISDPTAADFSVLNQADIVAAASSVTQTFTILLGAVAGISLIVGGIGIMNMMLTTVTERTREIGLRKAIGAKKKDINLQFLVEAVMLTFFGGLIGVIVGWLVSYIVALTGVVETSVSVGSVLLAFGVSAAIGIVFGYYPARRAANLNPIEALRYE